MSPRVRPSSSPPRAPRGEPSPPPLSPAEQEKRKAFIERNLWIALAGLLLFALALWGA